MKIIRNILSLCAIALLFAACGRQKAQTSGAQTDSVATGLGKTLIVFFSHSGENYAVGNIKVGNTKVLAGYLQEATGADTFEIKPVKSYDYDYRTVCDISKKEQEKNELPAFKGSIKNFNQYNTVIIGSPIWWDTFPQVVFTFLHKYNMNGKNVIIFTTHEGSGLGNTVNDFKQLYPKVKLLGEFEMAGHDVAGGKEKAQEWINSISAK